MKKINKRLTLGTESVRNLSVIELERASGGMSFTCQGDSVQLCPRTRLTACITC